MKWYAGMMILGFAVTGLSGCQNSVNVIDSEGGKVITDDYLRSRLAVPDITTMKRPDGLTTVQVTIRSTSDFSLSDLFGPSNPYRIEYKFDWLDQDSQYVKTAASTWIEMILVPGETQYIQAVSPSPECRRFNLQVKEFGQ